MGNVPIEHRHQRSLTQNSTGTVSVSIPTEFVRQLGWYKGQKVRLQRAGRRLIIQKR